MNIYRIYLYWTYGEIMSEKQMEEKIRSYVQSHPGAGLTKISNDLKIDIQQAKLILEQLQSNDIIATSTRKNELPSITSYEKIYFCL